MAKLKVLMHNLSSEVVKFEAGDRIAHLILERIAECEVVEADELPATRRSDRGFGRTGLRPLAKSEVPHTWEELSHTSEECLTIFVLDFPLQESLPGQMWKIWFW